MSKPLILTIHPKLEDTNLSPEDIRQGRWTELRLARRKRFTDTELAAEMHAANSAAWRAHSTKGSDLPLLEDRFETLYRFAALPHYDEVPA